mgnify:FL=1|tara:strand:+ start:1775 stop:1945 length:171 start_codon:yes stop_codon:yes gene_type:complete
MNKDQERAYRNLYDAVNTLFDTWDNIEDIYLSDFIAIRKAKIKVWREFHKQWEKEK